MIIVGREYWIDAMGMKKQERFVQAVAAAARFAKPVIQRGRPTPENLTAAGRNTGLQAIQAATRCTSIRRDGQPCRSVAMRGAKRCLKHGGRVEVPDHPHNIRRFLTGTMGKEPRPKGASPSDKELWDAMTYPQQREVLSLVSDRTIRDADRLYLAARIWGEVKGQGAKVEQRFFDLFLRA